MFLNTGRVWTIIVFMPSTRVILRIEVLPGVPASIDKTLEQFGSTHICVFSRLVAWFCEQDELTQAEILKLLPEIAGIDVSRRIIERLRDSVVRR
jgi:hypothetical protein